MRYTHDTWSIDLPENWLVEEADDSMAFFLPDGVGVIQISTYYTEDGEVTQQDLITFSGISEPEEADLPYLNGITNTDEEDGNLFINWWLRTGSEVFFISYICEKGDELIEVEQREYIVHSLRPHKVN